MVDLAILLATARTLAPSDVAIAVRDPAAAAPLWPGEALPRAIPKRQTEFAAGRACARAAMILLGAPPMAVPHGPDRAPVWPAGIHGSITHSAAACLAAITHAPRLIGIDLELATELDAELWQAVLLPSERAAIANMSNPGLQAKLFFSAKEAAYKAQYLRSRTLLDFDALEITLGDNGFTARFTQPIAGFAVNTLLQGCFCQSEGHFLTIVAG